MRHILVTLTLFVCLNVASVASALDQRYLEFTYIATVNDIPSDAKRVQIWLPYPPSDEHQIVDEMLIDTDFPVRITREPEYGNRMLYVEATSPLDSTLTVRMQFNVLRKEQQTGAATPHLSSRLRDRLLKPDALVPIDGEIAELAAKVTQGKPQVDQQTRAIYDYVTRTMSYDKSGTGWGRGDAIYACEVGKGNCTDFHSLIIGMARAKHIPAIFEIGFPIPPDQDSGEITGYHCWAELYVEGKGWIPVDSSEASKHPEKFEYFYGHLDPHRVLFSRGRDIQLQPPQAGPPLNYFIYPYVEVDGRPHDAVTRQVLFRDLPLPSWASAQ